MNEQLSAAPAALGRRDVLRRAALVGGAVVWTTPVVQSLGGVALAASGTPNTTDDCEPALFCWLQWLEQIFCVRWSWTPDCRRTDGASEQDLPRQVRADQTFAGAFSSIYGSYAGGYGTGRLGGAVECGWTSRGLRLTLDPSCVLSAWFLCAFPAQCLPTAGSAGGTTTSGGPECHWAQAPQAPAHARTGQHARTLLAAPRLGTPTSAGTSWGPALPTSGSVCDFVFA